MSAPTCQPLLLHETHEPRGAFGGFIGPRTLRAQVWNTAPWILQDAKPDDAGTPLHERAHASDGWRRVLIHAHQVAATDEPTQHEWLEYFALCLAAHFGTCGTCVPTDVDTKIRGHLWFRLGREDVLDAALRVALTLATWDIRPVSASTLTYPDHGTISGHDGERLSVLSAGYLRCLAADHKEGAQALADAIDAELRREVAIFEWLAAQSGREIEVALVAGNLTHNAGDLDQGLSCEEGRKHARAAKRRWGRLAHERFARFGGTFRRAAAVNRAIMAPEAHRQYPLRKIALLREDPRWMRPGGPFLDDWGEALARHDGWTMEQKGEVLDGLLRADRRVPGQVGYARALIGFAAGTPGGLDPARWKPYLRTAARRYLKSATLRKRLAVARASFEGSVRKRVRAILDG